MDILIGVFRPGCGLGVGFSANGAFYPIDWGVGENFDSLFTRIENRAPIIRRHLKAVTFMSDEIFQQFLLCQRQEISRLGTFIQRCFQSRNVIFEFDISHQGFTNINQYGANFRGQFAGVASSTSNHVGINIVGARSSAPLSLILR